MVTGGDRVVTCTQVVAVSITLPVDRQPGFSLVSDKRAHAKKSLGSTKVPSALQSVYLTAPSAALTAFDATLEAK